MCNRTFWTARTYQISHHHYAANVGLKDLSILFFQLDFLDELAIQAAVHAFVIIEYLLFSKQAGVVLKTHWALFS
jgi:hypothetical protein